MLLCVLFLGVLGGITDRCLWLRLSVVWSALVVGCAAKGCLEMHKVRRLLHKFYRGPGTLAPKSVGDQDDPRSTMGNSEGGHSIDFIDSMCCGSQRQKNDLEEKRKMKEHFLEQKAKTTQPEKKLSSFDTESTNKMYAAIASSPGTKEDVT